VLWSANGPAGAARAPSSSHPHNECWLADTGWQITVDQYFFTEVYYVVDTVVDQLEKNPKRHFIVQTQSNPAAH